MPEYIKWDDEPAVLEYQPHLTGMRPRLLSSYIFPPDTDLWETIVDYIIKESNQDLPVNVEALLRLAGAARIDYNKSQLPFQGRHMRSYRERLAGDFGVPYYRVVVTEDDANEFKRDNLAYEMARIFLETEIPNLPSLLLSTYFEKSSANLEEFLDRFPRMILAPKTLVNREISEMDGWHPLEKFVEILEKVHMPPYQLSKRLIEELGVIEGTFLVIPVGKNSEYEFRRKIRQTGAFLDPHYGEVGWAHTRKIPLPRDEKIREELAGKACSHIYHTRIRNVSITDKVRPLDWEFYTGVEGEKGANWTDLYESEGDFIVVGNDEPEFAICDIRLGDKVTELRDDMWSKFRSYYDILMLKQILR